MNDPRPVELTDFQFFDGARFANGELFSLFERQRPYHRREDLHLGYVARYTEAPDAWFATADKGDTALFCWYGPFRSRNDAAWFLRGSRAERDNPAIYRPVLSPETMGKRLLRDPIAPLPDNEPDLPESRRSEPAFRRAAPAVVSGFEILHIERWLPGATHTYASAVAVTYRREDAFCVHSLIWADDNEQRWQVSMSDHGMLSFERARWKANIRATHLTRDWVY